MHIDEKTLSTAKMNLQVKNGGETVQNDQPLFVENGNNNTRLLLSLTQLEKSVTWASRGYEDVISRSLIVNEAVKNIFDGIVTTKLADALILSAIAFVERDPAYSHVASRLLVKKLFKDVTGFSMQREQKATIDILYRKAFVDGIVHGVNDAIFDTRMLNFDLEKLAAQLVLERDDLFDYMGMFTLYERYFVRNNNKKHIELPQTFWMRVAMGIALEEKFSTDRAIEFYHVISQMHYVPGTPTLLHSGLTCPQLSSCFLGTVGDDLKNIFKCLGDISQLSKWSGGVAYDWTNIRGTGAMVKSIKTESQGLIPFLKIANDVTAAINRSGRRRSAACMYLETWHYDIEDFLDLRRNTGDERRRAHDINTANWVPDLFIKRVLSDGKWTLFSPDETPDLHGLYGKKFEDRYHEYEARAAAGKITLYKELEATKLWRKMLSRLFETGHPWITFKDPSNIRSPQDHAGVVNTSNLCTEIILNTSLTETAVCNLGSVNLAKHIVNGVFNDAQLVQTISVAMRMLDNVIDLNFYPTEEGHTSNSAHRPIGLGLMGLQDAFYQLDINFDSQCAVDFSNQVQEKIAYHAILASSQLAQEKGAYLSFKGSKWDRNILPQDTISLLEQERGMPIEVKKNGILDWTPVRESIKKYGMRNSNTMAIAPTATISTISGCYPCIEPIYKNLYVKSNMSGEFTVINEYLVNDLKKIDLWDQRMIDEIKYHGGSIQLIARIPERIKSKYKEAFEIDPQFLIQMTAERGQWIDQSQSHNIFMQGVSGKKLHDIYIQAWKSGLKTTYYLRSLGATQIEKSTLDGKEFGYTQKRSNGVAVAVSDATQDVALSLKDQTILAQSCSISQDPDCEVCQ